MAQGAAMKAVAIIPARFASSRFPGKPLVKILGREMILRVLDQVQKCKTLAGFAVATDDQRIFNCVVQAGYKAIMTDPTLRSGSDRVHQAAKEMNADLILNVQGDEPLISPTCLDRLVSWAQLPKNSNFEMGTLVHHLAESDLENKNIVKVILNKNSEAIYFSRWPIPFSRESFKELPEAPVRRHLGVYLYRQSALARFCSEAECEIEKAESLEQLRALHLGIRIDCVQAESLSAGVDVPDDILSIEAVLKNKVN